MLLRSRARDPIAVCRFLVRRLQVWNHEEGAVALGIRMSVHAGLESTTGGHVSKRLDDPRPVTAEPE